MRNEINNERVSLMLLMWQRHSFRFLVSSSVFISTASKPLRTASHMSLHLADALYGRDLCALYTSLLYSRTHNARYSPCNAQQLLNSRGPSQLPCIPPRAPQFLFTFPNPLPPTPPASMRPCSPVNKRILPFNTFCIVIVCS